MVYLLVIALLATPSFVAADELAVADVHGKPGVRPDLRDAASPCDVDSGDACGKKDKWSVKGAGMNLMELLPVAFEWLTENIMTRETITETETFYRRLTITETKTVTKDALTSVVTVTNASCNCSCPAPLSLDFPSVLHPTPAPNPTLNTTSSSNSALNATSASSPIPEVDVLNTFTIDVTAFTPLSLQEEVAGQATLLTVTVATVMQIVATVTLPPFTPPAEPKSSALAVPVNGLTQEQLHQYFGDRPRGFLGRSRPNWLH
jgi:hypothetical protein